MPGDIIGENEQHWSACQDSVWHTFTGGRVRYRAAQQLKVDSTMLDKNDKTMPV